MTNQTTMLANIKVSTQTPRVIGNVQDIESAEKVKEQGADFIEIRCDLAQPSSTEHVEALVEGIRNAVDLPIIATIRKTVDGGDWYKFKKNDRDRMPIFESIVDTVNGVDIELNADIQEDVTKLFKSKNKFVILSHHDFSKTPSVEEMLKLIEKMHDQDCDAIKTSFMTCGEEDYMAAVVALSAYVSDESNTKPISLITMGHHGRPGRFMLPLFGSCFTYGCAKNAKAPSQPRVEELVDYLKKAKAKKVEIPICLNTPSGNNALSQLLVTS